MLKNINNGIEIMEPFFFSKESKEGRVSSLGFPRIKKVALLFIKRYFFSKLSIFPISNTSLNAKSHLSYQVHTVWIVR